MPRIWLSRFSPSAVRVSRNVGRFTSTPLSRARSSCCCHRLLATIEIRQNIDTKCGLVLADQTQIDQVMMNLRTNAYHAIRERGGVLEDNGKGTGMGLAAVHGIVATIMVRSLSTVSQERGDSDPHDKF